MIRTLALASCFSLLASITASAIVDTNNNGLSDLWEKQYNYDELFHETFDPQADPDADGWTNAQEAAAGTNPFDSNPPAGFIRPHIVHIPGVLSAPDEYGYSYIVTPEAVILTWPTIPGKQYTLLASADLSQESWLSVGDPFIGNGSINEYGIPLTQPDGSIPEKLFWRVSVQDIDADGDGLTDAEEAELGTSALIRDTDGDGIPDASDSKPLSGTPFLADADGDGIADGDDPQPDNPRGVPPTLSSFTGSASQTMNVSVGEAFVFLVDVSNPDGLPASETDLKLFVGGNEQSAAFTTISEGRFSVSWNAQVHPNYPADILQSLTIRYQDSQNATAWIDLGRCDVAEWEGMIAGMRSGFDPSNALEIRVHSHHAGIYDTPERIVCPWESNNIRYRGPRTIPLLDTSGSATGNVAQIGASMRYPMFVFPDASANNQAIDVSNPNEYPDNGTWYRNQFSSMIHVAAPGDFTISSGETIFNPFPETALRDAFNMTPVEFYYIDSQGEHLFNESAWRYINGSSAGRKMYVVKFSPKETYPTEPTSSQTLVPLMVDASITPYSKGTLEHPGLPASPRATSGQWELPFLPVQSDGCYKLVLKVGPDAGAVSAGFRLELKSVIDSEESAPQAGFTLQVATAVGIVPLEIPEDGSIQVDEASAMYQSITSPGGLSLYLQKAPAADRIHRLSIVLLPTEKNLESGPQRITALNLLPVEIESNRATILPKFRGVPSNPYLCNNFDHIAAGEKIEGALTIYHKAVRDENGETDDFDVFLKVAPIGSVTWRKTKGPESGELVGSNEPTAIIRNPKKGGLYEFELSIGEYLSCCKLQFWLPVAGPDISSYWEREIAYFKNTWGPAYRAKLNDRTVLHALNPPARWMLKKELAAIDLFTIGGTLDWNGEIRGDETPCGGPVSTPGNRLTLHGFVISWSKRNNMLYALIGKEMGLPEQTLINAGHVVNIISSGGLDSAETVESYRAGFDLFDGARLENVMKSRGLKMHQPDGWDQWEWPSHETSEEELQRMADHGLQELIQ